MKLLALIAVLFASSACEDMLYSFSDMRRVGGYKNAHFVVMKPEVIEEIGVVSYNGKAFCKAYKAEDYCEIYIFTDPKAVPKQLPIKRYDGFAGVYKQVNGKGEFKKKLR